MYTSHVFHFSSRVHSCIDSLSIYGNKSSNQKKNLKKCMRSIVNTTCIYIVHSSVGYFDIKYLVNAQNIRFNYLFLFTKKLSRHLGTCASILICMHTYTHMHINLYNSYMHTHIHTMHIIYTCVQYIYNSLYICIHRH